MKRRFTGGAAPTGRIPRLARTTFRPYWWVMRTVADRLLWGSSLGLVLLAISGCARYEYVLVQPPQFARSITEKPTRINYPPMEYEFTEEDDSLLMAVINPGQEPIRIDPSKSFIV